MASLPGEGFTGALVRQARQASLGWCTGLARSQMIYAEAVPDQSVRHWTMAHRRALEYYGGVPGRWIIDNLKAGVHKADREEPQLNASFREFAQHYNVAVLPARSGRATDKGLVESAVGAVQTRILLALRHETFFSLDAMNAAIARELDRLNEAPMASGETRRAVFEATERTALQALPANPWEWGEWVERKVPLNGHARVEHYRRVPELVSELSRARDTGRHDRLMRRLAKVELLVLDDWGLQGFSAEGRRDLLEIVEQRYARNSIVVVSQIPVERWPRIIGEATIADAVLDRIVHNAYRIELTGESQRKRNKPPPLDASDPEPTKR